MKPIYIIGSGHRESNEFYTAFFKKSANIISLDGGSNLLKDLNILPDWIIGDFDSIYPETNQWLNKNGIIRYTFSPEKNFSDFELASQKIIQDYLPTQIELFCMQGKRSDHFLFNILISENLLNNNFNSIFHSEKEDIYFIDTKHPLFSEGCRGDIVSIIPINNFVYIECTKGLKYGLINDKLERNSTRGLSNIIINEKFEILVLEGQAMVIHTRILNK